ncbi:MAG: hypothetical protein PF795_03290 [Kiritimatiellae bacterium]|jgi:hypothetical protein|nr:hypothetical protein [Kiritimatiellia bacterium]
MGYYIDLTPLNPENVTLEEIDRHFQEAGCMSSPKREDDTIPEDKREFFQFEFWVFDGFMNFFLDEATGLPAGEIRISWSMHPEDFRQDLEEFLDIANRIDLQVKDFEIGTITRDNLPSVVDRYTRASASMRKLLGGSPPVTSHPTHRNNPTRKAQ